VARLKQHVGRFEIFGLLEASRLHRSIARPRDGSALSFADRLSISRRQVMSPIRVLIEAVLPNPDHLKQKSRWVFPRQRAELSDFPTPDTIKRDSDSHRLGAKPSPPSSQHFSKSDTRKTNFEAAFLASS
jgi:hypothetical protein